VLQNLVVICLQQQQTSINREKLKPVSASAEKVAQTAYHTADGLGAVAYPGILFGGGSTNSVEDRVRGSGGSCNLVQEISFHIVQFS